MVNNRVTEWLGAIESPSRFVADDDAFVVVPASLFMSPAQINQAALLYRMAAERARQQLERRSSPLPRFSLN